MPISDLTIYDPLRAVGLDDDAIAWVARHFKSGLAQQWADITLAAKERHGASFFKKSPQAYFVDNLRQAAEGGRTPPDWWWACKKEQEQRIASPLAHRLVATCSQTQRKTDRAFLEYLKGRGRAKFEQVIRDAMYDFCRGGMPREEALKRATKLSHDHLKRQFNQERIA